MSEHRAEIGWQRGDDAFEAGRYSLDHEWLFAGGIRVAASGTPEFGGSADLVDPEQAFVAALSSCHMLTFLAIAAKRGFVVDHYRDAAVGFLEKNSEGRRAITRVELRPCVTCSGERQPDADELDRLHALAHAACFIANSVRAEVRIVAQAD